MSEAQVIDAGPGATGQPTVRGAAGLSRAFRRGRVKPRGRAAVYLSMAWVALLLVVAVTVQWIPVHDYTTTVAIPNLGLNSSTEFLGTDAIGRSTLSRILWGARVSIGISFMATLIAMIVGGLLGLLTAYFGRWLTPVVDVITNSVLAVPSLLLLLSIVLALTPTIPTLMGALSLIFIPAFMRLTRANARSQISRDYVTAARALGASNRRIIFREVLPNTLPSLVSYAALVLPSIVVTEGSLSYLGFGVQAPVPSWGGMIAQAQQNLSIAAAPALVPCVVLFLTVFSLNTLGDYLRIRLDVRDAQL